MPRELFIVRHAKSDWANTAHSDFERPLKKRGVQDAQNMGSFLKSQELIPDFIVSSTARRAMETAKLLAKSLGIKPKDITYNSDLYLCQPHTLVKLVENISSIAQKAMIVGHNPSMDFMVQWLSRSQVPTREDGKLMTTTAIAHFQMPDIWCPLPAHAGELLHLWRPKDLGSS